MIRPRSPIAAKPAAGPAATRGTSGPRPWNLRLLAACLGLLLAAYAYREARDALPGVPARPLPETASRVVFPPKQDLEPVRANWTHPVPVSPFRFTEITRDAGIDFVHASGMTEAKHFPTAYGSGVAMFDYDGDGLLDLYFATMARLPVGKARTGPNRLYRNLGGNRFEEATARSGLGYEGFCHGIVVGDIDNDGDPDVFLCNYGPNVLYLNRGDGTFEDISRAAGIDRPGWSFAGAFLDYDNDGDLDLYVVNYGSWTLPDDDRACYGAPAPFLTEPPPKLRVYCSPRMVPPARHTLYRNNGDHTFSDVTAAAGLARTDGRGLGVVAADLNDDGLTDLYIANDMCINFTYINCGNGTFQDLSESSGAGYGPDGTARAGMGVDAEDLNGDGRAELLVTNFWNEALGLFVNLGDGLFDDRARRLGLFHDSVMWVGWGCALADFDRDGWPDCFVANGHIDDNLERLGHHTPYAEPPLLFRNVQGRQFQLATRDAGAYFDADHLGRGAAQGDIDNDGDIDLVVSHKDGLPALLRNDTRTDNHWIRLTLQGVRSNRDAVGARVELDTGERVLTRQRKGGGSLASAHDPRLLVGTGAASVLRGLTVRWPSGQVDQFRDVTSDRDYLIREGTGRLQSAQDLKPTGPIR
jgi:hypothetical protein